MWSGRARGWELQICRLDQGDALFVLGGPMGVANLFDQLDG